VTTAISSAIQAAVISHASPMPVRTAHAAKIVGTRMKTLNRSARTAPTRRLAIMVVLTGHPMSTEQLNAYRTNKFPLWANRGACGEGPKRIGQHERTATLSQLGALSRDRAVTSFNALERSNTGSAKNTPKSDMDLLARIQHLASLNWASHRIVARSPTSCVPGPGARSRMPVGILLSYSHLLFGRAVKEDGSNIGGPLELRIRNVAARTLKKTARS
jgi:hypothetical protein